MSKVSFLELQYKILKKFPSKLARAGSLDRQCSGLSQVFLATEAEMEQVFSKFGVNKDGKITRKAYHSFWSKLRDSTVKCDEVAKIFCVADEDGDGYIDFKDFMAVHNGGEIQATDIRNAFRIFDSDGKGKISAEDVYRIMKGLGECCSLEECQRMVKGVDANEDGFVDMEEFMNMMTQTLTPATA